MQSSVRLFILILFQVALDANYLNILLLEPFIQSECIGEDG